MTTHLACFLLVVALTGCALDVLESSSAGRDTKYFSNSLCGVVSFDEKVGLYLEERGTVPNQGELELWAYNFGPQDTSVQLSGLKPFPLARSKFVAVQLVPGGIAPLLQMTISMPYYGPVSTVLAEVSVDGASRTGRIVLNRKEHTSYWHAVFGGCDRPKSVEEFLIVTGAK